MVDWSWALGSAYTTPWNNNLTLCATPNSTLFSSGINATSFGLPSNYFSFGQISNNDQLWLNNLGQNISITVDTMELGLVLSEELYENYFNMLSIATSGALSCTDKSIPCVIPQSCSMLPPKYYFTFYADFPNAMNVSVPLESFAY